MATKTLSVSVKADATVAADGFSDVVRCKNVTKASVYAVATLAGTTPSFNCFIQTKDANGNWHDVGSGAGAITATGSTSEVAVAGPFGDEFRVRMDVDVADTDETYTGVDVALALEYEE